jgi:pimeloyl-ACP methyl ester carboxylesterase
VKTLTANGTGLAAVDRGSGPPLLFVHGFPLDHTMWDAQVETLSGRHRIIAPDLRGFGQSGVTEPGKGDRHLLCEAPEGPFRQKVPVTFSHTATMELFADDLAGLLDAMAAGQRVVLCGLSMGGYIAFAFCRRYAARLRGLILCDTRAEADTPEAAAARLETADRVLGEGPGFLADSMLPKLLAPQTLAERPETVAAVRKMILGSDPRGIAAALRGMAQRPDSTPLLSAITCPTLVLVGELDKLSPPEQMQALARQISGSQFVVIPNAGHMTPVEQPAETTAAIESFLLSIA